MACAFCWRLCWLLRFVFFGCSRVAGRGLLARLAGSWLARCAPATRPCLGGEVSGGVRPLLDCSGDLPLLGGKVSGGVWALLDYGARLDVIGATQGSRWLVRHASEASGACAVFERGEDEGVTSHCKRWRWQG